MFMRVVTLRRAKLHLLPHRCGFALVASPLRYRWLCERRNGADTFLSGAALGRRWRSGHARPAGADRWRAAWRYGLSRAVPLDRAGRQADPGLRHRDRAARSTAARRPPDRCLGASDFRDRAALRAFACDLYLPADPGSALHGRTRLRGRGDGLSGAGYAGTPSLPCRGERSARGDRLGARCGHFARRGRRDKVRGLGPFARRAGCALHRNDREDLCTRTCASRRRRCCACHRSCDLDERRHRLQSAAGTSRP